MAVQLAVMPLPAPRPVLPVLAPERADFAFYCRALGCYLAMHTCLDRQAENARELARRRRLAGSVGDTRRKRGSAPEFVSCTVHCQQGRQVLAAVVGYESPPSRRERSDLAEQHAAFSRLERVGLLDEVPSCDAAPWDGRNAAS